MSPSRRPPSATCRPSPALLPSRRSPALHGDDLDPPPHLHAPTHAPDPSPVTLSLVSLQHAVHPRSPTRAPRTSRIYLAQVFLPSPRSLDPTTANILLAPVTFSFSLPHTPSSLLLHVVITSEPRLPHTRSVLHLPILLIFLAFDPPPRRHGPAHALHPSPVSLLLAV